MITTTTTIYHHSRTFHSSRWTPVISFRRRQHRPRFPVKLRQPIPFISDVKEARNPTDALHLFNKYQELGFHHHYPSYSALAYRLARCRDFETLDFLLLHIRDTGVPCKERMFTALIQHYGESSLPHKSLHLFHSMPSFNSPRSLQSLNTLINSLVDNHHLPAALSLLRRSKTMALSPNAVTFNILIKGYLRGNDFQSARQVFDEMSAKKVEPSTVTYNSFVGFLSRAGRVEEARRMVDDMTERGRAAPNAVTYALLMHGFCLVGEHREAEKVLFDMDYKGCVPNAVNFAVLVKDLGERGRLEEAKEVVRKMRRRKGMIVDTRIHNILIEGMCREGRMKEAEKELVEMEMGGRCKPNGASYGMVVDGFCEGGDVEKGVDVLRLMVAAGCIPRVETYVRLVFELFRKEMAKDDEEAWFVLEEMRKDGVVLPLEVWEVFVAEWCRRGLRWYKLIDSLVRGDDDV